ncbi:MAG: MGMT family protein [Patescibacteria group bacterium]
MKKPKKKYKQASFKERVYTIVARIPRGKTLTYKQVAAKAGKPNAARAVGTLMSKNFDPKIPCHRVVRSDGKIGGYNRGGPQKKIELIMMERYTAGYGK